MDKIKWMQAAIGFTLGVLVTAVFLTVRERQSPMAIQIIPPAATATAGPTATPAPISVYINGAIRNPGVYEVAADARLEQLLVAAGGMTSAAYVEGVNLAAPLFDGAQIFIADQAQAAVPSSGVTVSNLAADSAGAAAGATTGLININTADRATLEQIPGVGPSTADKIMAHREDNGPFLFIEDIMDVSGIGEGKFEQMRESITIGNR